GLAAVSEGACPDGRRFHAARMGRPHSGVSGRPRGGAEGPTIHDARRRRTIAGRSAGGGSVRRSFAGEAFDDGRDAPSAALRRARSAMTPHDDSPLARLQRWMQAVITHPGGVAEGAASDDARRHLADSPSGIEQVISRSQRLTSEERLAIYSHAYFARLLECLRAVFP